MFNGWNRLDEKRNWKDVELVQVRPVPADPADLEWWRGRWG